MSGWIHGGALITGHRGGIRLIHGTADTDVPPDHGDHAAATVPGAELLPMETGTHLCLYTHPDAAAAQARAVDVLQQGGWLSPPVQ